MDERKSKKRHFYCLVHTQVMSAHYVVYTALVEQIDFPNGNSIKTTSNQISQEDFITTIIGYETKFDHMLYGDKTPPTEGGASSWGKKQ